MFFISTTKITLVINSLSHGGAEKIITLLAKGLADRGYDITLLTIDKKIKDFYKTANNYKRVYASDDADLLCSNKGFSCFLKRSNALRKSILSSNCNLTISFIDVTNIKVLLALFREMIPVIASEHTDPRFHDIGWKWELFRRLSYPTAAKVVMLTEETKEWAEKQWPKWNVTAIPNPVLPPVFSPNLTKPKWFNKRNLVAMGRLTHVKGFDMLIDAFDKIAARFPEWNLTILGEGDLRGQLENQVKIRGLSERIILPGNVNPPFDILKQADLFVMSSRYEGFPNAICEAMACGLPVVSFDCPSGPRAIIRNGIDGILVPDKDIKALANVLSELMEDEERRRKLAGRAPEILERFSLESYLDKWEELIAEALTKKKKILE